MTQTSNRLFDELARLMTDAANVAQGVRREASTAFRSQAERLIADLDLVRREDFDVVRETGVAKRGRRTKCSRRVWRRSRPSSPPWPAKRRNRAGTKRPRPRKTPQNQGVRRARPSRPASEPAKRTGTDAFL